MASTGYIDASGVYRKVKRVPIARIVKTRTSMYQQGDWSKQRFDHAAEIVQPYTVDGKPNEKFIEAFPEDAAKYGLTPNTFEREPDPLGESHTPTPEDNDFGGSVPWDYMASHPERMQ